MADNFNLRTFLSENKLTKNAQLLKEEESQKQEVYYDDILFHIHARYPNLETAIQGVKEYLDGGNGVVTFDTWEKAEVPYLEFDGPCYFLVGPGEEPGQHPPLLVSVRNEDLITDPKIVAQYKADDEAGDSDEEGDNINEVSDYGFDELMDIVDTEYDGDPAIAKAVEDAFNNGQIDTSEFGHDINAASNAVAQIANGIDIEAAQHSIETQFENKMTTREQKLVEMVQRALGEENVDYTMGRQDDPNQLPNPAPELNIPEGDEMADETVIPEYNTIDELMNSIDHGTNKVAEEHKMEQMKKIAEALRMKAKKMEESEHAAHISPKDLKQLATDAAKLEKAAEKLKAAFDKKFNKKEKPAAAPKAEKVEALQEGAFDLRKFLAENRK